MNFAELPVHILHFLDDVTAATVDDDLDDDTPRLLCRARAAEYLGMSVKYLSDLSGNGARGGQIRKYAGGRGCGQSYYEVEELDRYLRVRANDQR